MKSSFEAISVKNIFFIYFKTGESVSLLVCEYKSKLDLNVRHSQDPEKKRTGLVRKITKYRKKAKKNLK